MVTMIKAWRCLMRFLSFLPCTLPLFGWFTGMGSPGLHGTQAYGPVITTDYEIEQTVDAQN
jgi:hypothetical protein